MVKKSCFRNRATHLRFSSIKDFKTLLEVADLKSAKTFKRVFFYLVTIMASFRCFSDQGTL